MHKTFHLRDEIHRFYVKENMEEEDSLATKIASTVQSRGLKMQNCFKNTNYIQRLRVTMGLILNQETQKE